MSLHDTGPLATFDTHTIGQQGAPRPRYAAAAGDADGPAALATLADKAAAPERTYPAHWAPDPHVHDERCRPTELTNRTTGETFTPPPTWTHCPPAQRRKGLKLGLQRREHCHERDVLRVELKRRGFGLGLSSRWLTIAREQDPAALDPEDRDIWHYVNRLAVKVLGEEWRWLYLQRPVSLTKDAMRGAAARLRRARYVPARFKGAIPWDEYRNLGQRARLRLHQTRHYLAVAARSVRAVGQQGGGVASDGARPPGERRKAPQNTSSGPEGRGEQRLGHPSGPHGPYQAALDRMMNETPAERALRMAAML